MKNLRVLVADDHEVVRRGVISLIKSHLGWEVCGEAENGRMAVDSARELKPDVVVLDLGMPILNGLEATRRIVRDNPRVKVLILTLSDRDWVVRDAFEAGARGFVLKSDASRDLVASLQALGDGNMFLTARVSEIVLSGYLEFLQHTKGEDTLSRLSPREREIIQLLAEGKSTKEVACVLSISSKTAETHRNNLMRKLNLHSVQELVIFAVRNGIIQVAARGIDSTIGQQLAQKSIAS
jgi:DNA-binding NarL/FixJ family response regulator